MEFTSSPENIIDGFFANIWSKLKRTGSFSNEPPSKMIKNEEIKMQPIILKFENHKSCQTNNIPYMTYFDNIVKCLSCVICQDLCVEAFQCLNGHLLCSNCHSLLNDQKTTKCPVCRVSLKDNVTRSLVTEHLIREMPDVCTKCSVVLQRCMMKPHMLYKCSQRSSDCKYKLFGCQWIDSVKNIVIHEKECFFNNKMVIECFPNFEEYISKNFALVGNDSIILKSILDNIKNKNQSISIKLYKIGLRFISKEVNDQNKIYTFGNSFFKDGLKIRLKMSINTNFVDIKYCLSGNKNVDGELSFYLYELKMNYIKFDIQDNLRLHKFNNMEAWSDWFMVQTIDPLSELVNSIQNVEGRCIHIGMILITNLNIEKNSSNDDNHWRAFVNDVLNLESIDRQIEQSEAMLNQLAVLRGFNSPDDVLDQNQNSENLAVTSVEIADSPSSNQNSDEMSP